MRYGLILLALVIVPIFPLHEASAYVGQYCWEQLPDGLNNNLCGLTSGNITQTFQAFNQPIEEIQSGFSLVILWGGIIGIIWFKTERIDLVGITGIMVSATETGLSPTAVGIGFTLLFISLGILLFQVVRQRITIYT